MYLSSFFFSNNHLIYSLRFAYIYIYIYIVFTNANIWFIVFQETKTIHWNIKGDQVSCWSDFWHTSTEIFIVLVFIVGCLQLFYPCLILSTKKYCLYFYLAICDFKLRIVKFYFFIWINIINHLQLFYYFDFWNCGF